jgi:hypothetical protein
MIFLLENCILYWMIFLFQFSILGKLFYLIQYLDFFVAYFGYLFCLLILFIFFIFRKSNILYVQKNIFNI